MSALWMVPCGRAKLAVAAPARLLYTGAHFRWVLNRVTAAAGGAAVRILSARHGLVHPHRVLAPYDTILRDPDAITPAQLADQLVVHLPGRGRLMVHAFLPRAYLARLTAGLMALGRPAGWTVRDHYAGCAGIGAQRHVVASLGGARGTG